MALITEAREIATVLAALRHYQASGFGDMHALPADLAAIAVDGARGIVPLDDEELDALCERINCVHAAAPPAPDTAATSGAGASAVREAVAVAIIQLFETDREDTLAAFSPDELATVVAVTASLREHNVSVESVYRRAWNIVRPAPPCSHTVS